MKTTKLRSAVACLVLLLAGLSGNAQNFPELVFDNPILISGSAGQNGAKYRFPNVATGANALDAIVEIRGRSGNNVTLKTIDNTSSGWDKAFQPELGINGSIPANHVWWMDFRMEFVEAGTNDKKEIDKFFITALDIDGDGNRVREWMEMKKVKNVSTASNNSLVTNLLNTVLDLLNPNNNGSDAEVIGPYTNYNNIDTASTSVMATYEYENKDKIDFRLGGRKSNSNGSGAGMRMNSLWFKQFTLASNLATLPVELIDFTATLNRNRVDLKWTTASEKNVSHFEVERSLDGVNYSQAGIVFAYGNTSEVQKYEFPNDITGVQSAAIFYRLRSVDIDGRNEYSQVRIIRPETGRETMTLAAYPNPVVNELRVTLPPTWQGREVSFGIFDQKGVEVKKTRMANASQTESIGVNDLPRGFYIIRASCGEAFASQKIIKN